jgi:hypothetical protein
MSHGGRPFRYPLAPLLIKRTWDVDVARRELMTAQRVLSLRKEEQARLHGRLQEARAEASRLVESGSTIDITRYRLLGAYAAELEASAVAKLEEVGEAESLCSGLFDNLRKDHCALNGMERHRDRLRLEHETERLRAQFREADDTWVMRHEFRREGE